MIMLLRWIARIGGLAAFVLGLMISRSPVLQLHMTIGGIVAGALAIIAAWALAQGVRVPVAVVALLWAAATVYVGMKQMQWMTDGGHWIVEVVHALIGIGAIGLAEMLGAGIMKRGSLR
jgi:hypothetical protein